MKKLSFFSMMCLTALSIVAIISCTKNDDETEEPEPIIDSYVDLGLPSGTKWKTVNEVNPNKDENDFYTWDEAMAAFGNELPTLEQFVELYDNCSWTWNGTKKGYDVKGGNGNSIFLPAVGYRECNGNVIFEGEFGSYWSSTPYGSEEACNLHFLSNFVSTQYLPRCNGLSVRLVQN